MLHSINLLSVLGAVYQNQILYQTCVTIEKFNATQCEPLLGIDRASDADKVSVSFRPTIIYYAMYHVALVSVLAVVAGSRVWF